MQQSSSWSRSDEQLKGSYELKDSNSIEGSEAVGPNADTGLMDYRTLSNTGMRVSAIGITNWLGHSSFEDLKDCVQAAFKAGINYFEACNNNLGKDVINPEISLGRAIRELGIPRNEVILCTKMLGQGWTRKFSRKGVIEGMRESLRRMKLTYLDIVFVYNLDTDVDMEELCRSCDWLVKQGWIMHWATSEWPASAYVHALWICDKHHLHKPICDQLPYSMVCRQPLDKDFNYVMSPLNHVTLMCSTMINSPLCSGLLTGKYVDNVSGTMIIPDDSRLANAVGVATMQSALDQAEYIDKHILLSLMRVADECKIELGTLAIAWVLANPKVAGVIVHVKNKQQLATVIEGVAFFKNNWSEDIEGKINLVLQVPRTNKRSVCYTAQKYL